MKQVGRCEQCSKPGVLETVDVTEAGAATRVVHLHLCSRCAVVPSAVWRRRYQPVARATTADRGEASSSPNRPR